MLLIICTYFEIVILVPDSAMMRFRVPPPLPAEGEMEE